jgi:O-antigen ligase
MNEIILIIIFLAILFGLQLLISRIKKPLLFYIRISSAIALLLLVWLFGGDSDVSVRVILSAIALTSVYNGYLSVKQFQTGSNQTKL